MSAVIYPPDNPEIFDISCKEWFWNSHVRDIQIDAQEEDLSAGLIMAVDTSGKLIPFDATQDAIQPLYVLASPLPAGETSAEVIVWGIVLQEQLSVKTGNLTDSQGGLTAIERLHRYSQIRVQE